MNRAVFIHNFQSVVRWRLHQVALGGCTDQAVTRPVASTAPGLTIPVLDRMGHVTSAATLATKVLTALNVSTR